MEITVIMEVLDKKAHLRHAPIRSATKETEREKVRQGIREVNFSGPIGDLAKRNYVDLLGESHVRLFGV